MQNVDFSVVLSHVVYPPKEDWNVFHGIQTCSWILWSDPCGRKATDATREVVMVDMVRT
jgi:hypothetical protein